jgi:hypothetical protein
MQFLAYQAQGIPVVWSEEDELTTYTGPCAHAKVMDRTFISPELFALNRPTKPGYPKVEPLDQFLRHHPDFCCYGCYSYSEKSACRLKTHSQEPPHADLPGSPETAE